MHPSRILVIEDNEENLSLMRLLLERENYDVIAASDGFTGLDLARSEHPDLILLDLAMPEIDGWDVARKLKGNIITQSIPVIAVTAHALPKNRELAMEAGCNAFIVKPFSVAKLIDEIESLLDW